MVGDDLFKLPLDQFTAARNELAASLKKAGKAGESDQVRTLIKPSMSAWAVNQLFWHHRKPFEQLIATGERFRKAQEAQFKGKAADLRGTLEARREALQTLSRLAATVLRDSDHPATPDMMRRITTTLEALASYAGVPEAPAAGRLTADVDPPGFEALAALVPQIGRASSKTGATRLLTFQPKKPATAHKKLSPDAKRKQQEEEQRAQRAAARVALQEAEKTLTEARRDAERAEAALKKAAASAREADKAKAEIEARYEKLAAAAEAARLEARRVAAEAEDAAQAVEDAERAVKKATSELESLA